MGKKKKYKVTRKRIVLLVILISAWGGAIVYSLVNLQILQHEWLVREANSQTLRSIDLIPKRGNIYDRNMRELAVSVQTGSIYADPLYVKDAKETAEQLSPITGIETDTLFRMLGKTCRFVWIRRKVSDGDAEAVSALNLPGIGILREDRRMYPKESLAAHLLGFSGIDNQGLGGLEYRFDSEIRGKVGKGVIRRDGTRQQIGIKVLTSPRGGNHLVLTLDEVIQYITQKELFKAWKKNRADWVAAVVMDPGSGRILAMANFPDFDPNQYSRSSKQSWINRCISNLYAPGSTFKIITVASALRAGKVSPDDTFYCKEGGIAVGNTYIRDHKPFGTLSLAEVLHHSSNVGAILIGTRVAPHDFYRGIAAFGFGEKTRIELPGEECGILHEVENWSGISQAEMCIGQEINVTPLQMLCAAASIANGGVLYRPMIVEQVLSSEEENKILKTYHPEPVHRVLSPKTAGVLSQILQGVVDGGTGRRAAIPGYAIAGKTGTAQKLGSKYGQYVASFVGYFPVQAPRIAIIIVIDNPKGEEYYGGQIAAPVFKDIAGRIISYLHMPPMDSSATIHVAVSSGKGEHLPKKEKRNLSWSQPVQVASYTYVPDGTSLIVQNEEMKMPDLTGLCLKDSVYVLTRMGLQPVVNGNGFLIRQRPASGARIDPDEICYLTFSQQSRIKTDSPVGRE